MGWDLKLREQTLARQIEMGIVPEGTKLAPKPAAIKDWDSLSKKEQELYAHQFEVFAGFAEFTDHEVGRLLDALREKGLLENTLVFYIVGDNGSSGEGTMTGVYNEMTALNDVIENFDDIYNKMDNWGDPTTYPHYACGWAVAGDAPFAYTKQVASDFGQLAAFRNRDIGFVFQSHNLLPEFTAVEDDTALVTVSNRGGKNGTEATYELLHEAQPTRYPLFYR